MKNILSKKIWLFPILVLLAFSCGKNDLDDLSKVIYVRHKGADMPAFIHGNASEKVFLIILHGGPGGDGLAYRGGTIKSEIEKECAVVYFDQRGSGLSQGNYSESDLTVELMVEDVMALTDVIRHKYGEESRFFLMGHSWGGTLGTATLLANDNQERFKGWIEVDGGHDLKELYFENIRFFKEVAAEQIALNQSLDYWNNVLEKVNEVDSLNYDEDDSSYMNTKAFDAEEVLADDGFIDEIDDATAIDGLRELLSNNQITIFWNSINTNTILVENQEIFETLSYTSQLGKITIPSLVLWGKYDLVIPPKQGQEAFDNLGSEDKEIVIFEKSGHSPMINEGDKFAEEVIGFINQFK